ncbi:MAG: glycosyltransferase [Acidobacteria bacterium]|nr:glycosyltransferase [Acidobacteriota bacterium]
MPDISILIPTYTAADFIDRTLRIARGQTHPHVSILVSVDACADGTLDRVRAHARDDARIVVFAQEHRLGWAANVNFLIDQVRTPYFFVYFHDDVIVAEYAARLVAALEAAPDAASVHADVQHFGASDQLSRGREYAGPAPRRLLSFMLAPHRGSPLRSLIRRDRAGHLRLPDHGAQGYLANEPFLLDLIAAGPALHVPAPLYFRHHFRPGGLTAAWRHIDATSAMTALRAHAARAVTTLERVAGPDAALRSLLLSAAWFWLAPHVEELERRTGRATIAGPADLHPAFAQLADPAAFEACGAGIAGWYAERWHRSGVGRAC